jgi:Secretion system C-terminal sorting domain
MQKIAIIIALCCLRQMAMAQLYNNGSLLQINGKALVQVNGDFTNAATSDYKNDGRVVVKGTVTNNQTMGSYYIGTLIFSGGTAQTLSGTAAMLAKNVEVNNTLGLTLATPLKIDGECKFITGIVTAASAANAVTFTSSGFVSTTNAPTDASHVNGYVVKEGTGSFEYPVGNGIRYQKTATNLSANSSGMQVNYNLADAGTATFTSTGSEANPLGGYNNKEYWNITPLGTATGTVTIFWEGYNDVLGNYKSSRRVAHKVAGGWQNEGTIGTGNESVGQVISNSINTWSPFTLGSTAVILPLNLLSFSGSKMNGYNHLNWATANEQNTKHFELESSSDGRSFTPIAIVNTAGSGNHKYSYNDKNPPLGDRGFYRLKMVDADRKFTYSTVVLINQSTNQPITIYPNPAVNVVNISMANALLLHTNVQLTDAKGAVIQVIKLTSYQQAVNVQSLSKGVYMLHFKNGTVLKFIKE